MVTNPDRVLIQGILNITPVPLAMAVFIYPKKHLKSNKTAR